MLRGELTAFFIGLARDAHVFQEIGEFIQRQRLRAVDPAVRAIATSGSYARFVEIDGRRYSHILDPRTGWPVPDAPRSVTVAADSCTQAGMLSTLAMLKGAQAEKFLRGEGAQFWCNRGAENNAKSEPDTHQ